MSSFYIITLGCKVNQYESETLAEQLIQSGWRLNHSAKNSDIIIINTCTVTQRASMQARQEIRKAIRSSPEAQIFVTGCYAQTEPEQIEKIEGVNYIIGQGQKHAIADMILSQTKSFNNNLSADPIMMWNDINEMRDFAHSENIVSSVRTRPILKIQDGCNCFCTYCIVPHARGRSRSMPFEQVINSISQIGASGFNEIVLSGIHLGNYGKDLTPGTDLYNLLAKICDLGLIKRLRLSSIEPNEISDDIIRLIQQSDILCPHLHIPLQSGDDTILKSMKRPYSRSYFKELICKLVEEIPQLAIGVDALIGFPGEREIHFNNTYELINEISIAYAHVFPFSRRKGTPADTFPNQIDPAIVKHRCNIIRKLGNKKRMDFSRQMIGKTVEVLLEGKSKDEKWHKGLARNYVPVVLKGDIESYNKLIQVKTERLHEGHILFGTMINDA